MKKALLILLALMIPFAACAQTAPYEYRVGEEGAYYENYIYPADVIISGENAQIVFVGCTFEENIILTAREGTRVLLLGCRVMGECRLENDMHDADINYNNPKFLTDAPVTAVCADCAGTVVGIGDVEITFNGQTYTMADAQLFIDDTNLEQGIIPYEGQEAHYLAVGMWNENGQHTVTAIAEYAPEE